MEAQEIKNLLKSFGKNEEFQLIETHISWIILTEKFAYKFKKSIRYSFLNYAKLARRKYYCEREVQLNSRFSNIYIGVVSVCKAGRRIVLESGGEIIDYGVKMKRINSDFQMDYMIEHDLVSAKAIKKLAKTIAKFHLNAEIIRKPFSIRNVCQTFNDLGTIKNFLYNEIGLDGVQQINEAILESNHYLNSNVRLLNDRIKYGFVRDVHGDLHAKNIFLLKKPILFDCIEFDDELRQIDLLSEIAFVCMDLEARNREDLSKEFLQTYLDIFPIIGNDEDRRLFSYYKCYRANVRIKVHAMLAKQADSDEEKQNHLVEVVRYMHLMMEYVGQFSGNKTAAAFEILGD